MRWIMAELFALSLAVGCTPQGQDQAQYPQSQNQYSEAPYQQGQYQNPQYQNPNYRNPSYPNPQPGSSQNAPYQSQPAPQGQMQSPQDMSSMGQRHLGVSLLPLTRDLRSFFGAPPDRGVLVAHVEPGSAADGAGVRAGDVIVQVEGRPVMSAQDVISALAMQQRDQIPLDVIRNGRVMRTTAMLSNPQQSDQRSSPPM